MNDFTPNLFDFDSSQSVDLNETEGKEIVFFHYLLDYDLVAHIATETNKYCSEYLKKTSNLTEHSKVRRWVNTTPDELYCFSGVFLLMPLSKKCLEIVLDN